MGFMGRYGNAEDAFLLEQLKTSNLKVLTGASVGIPSLKKGELFPEAYPAPTQEKIPERPQARFKPHEQPQRQHSRSRCSVFCISSMPLCSIM
jgi:hypothetical protein